VNGVGEIITRVKTTFGAGALLLWLLLVGGNGFAKAQSPVDPAGQWVYHLGIRTLFILSLSPASGHDKPVSGSLTRPRHFRTNDFWSFSDIHGGIETEPIVKAVWRGDVLSVTFQDPQDSSDKDTFLFKLKDPDHAQFQMEGVPLPAIELTRLKEPQSIASDWDKEKTYSPDDGLPSNPEMKRIFDEDQHVRQPRFKVDWDVVAKSDAARREAVAKLLDEGSLHTGEDFTWAAFLFQHGSTPEDYLLAHTLAMIAMGKGYGNALWIATATLDRYLQSVHQEQIYGTQFVTPPNQPNTQGAYNRKLISDALRRRLGVPIQSAQEEQLKQYDVERVPPKS
jgi:hypothetical protein